MQKECFPDPPLLNVLNAAITHHYFPQFPLLISYTPTILPLLVSVQALSF